MLRLLTLRTSTFKTSNNYKTLSSNHYELLGVKYDASQKEIKTAYYNLAKKFHPDTQNSNSSGGETVKEGQKSDMAKVNAAYSVLSSEDTRKDYDNEIRASKPHSSSSDFTSSPSFHHDTRDYYENYNHDSNHYQYQEYSTDFNSNSYNNFSNRQQTRHDWNSRYQQEKARHSSSWSDYMNFRSNFSNFKSTRKFDRNFDTDFDKNGNGYDFEENYYDPEEADYIHDDEFYFTNHNYQNQQAQQNFHKNFSESEINEILNENYHEFYEDFIDETGKEPSKNDIRMFVEEMEDFFKMEGIYLDLDFEMLGNSSKNTTNTSKSGKKSNNINRKKSKRRKVKSGQSHTNYSNSTYFQSSNSNNIPNPDNKKFWDQYIKDMENNGYFTTDKTFNDHEKFVKYDYDSNFGKKKHRKGKSRGNKGKHKSPWPEWWRMA